MGYIRHDAAADLPVPARARATPSYVIADNFFQAAFGGSFLNHQWLVAAATPVWSSMPPASAHVDRRRQRHARQLSALPPPATVKARPARDDACGPADDAAGHACAATTRSTPSSRPTSRRRPGSRPRKLPPQTRPDDRRRAERGRRQLGLVLGRLVERERRRRRPGLDERDTARTCTDPATIARRRRTRTAPTAVPVPSPAVQLLRQLRAGHRPRAGAPAGRGRVPRTWRRLGGACNLPAVSFVKPIGAENEHPGYTGESRGSHHLVELLSAIEDRACGKDTMVVVTYDEFGGQWDHVPPPGQGGAAGPHDQWGPGTRIPALILSPLLQADFVVDHEQATRRRSWQPSSTASASTRWGPATRASTISAGCSPPRRPGASRKQGRVVPSRA